jgi:hypothetical protein
VLTGAVDEEWISRGVYDAYTKLNLRYSQMAPLTMWDEKNTGSNLPAQIELYSTPAKGDPAYKFLFMAKGGGSANKSFLFQETKAVLNPDGMMKFLDEKIRSLGTAACPPYHLAIVVGGTSAEYALKTAKYASAHYLDSLPTSGNDLGRGFRDLELEADVLSDTRPLVTLVEALKGAAGSALRFMRDPTRGGVGTVLNELARDTGFGVVLREDRLPIRDVVHGACEILGIDPLYVANEGKLLAVVAPEAADAALEALRGVEGGEEAQIIGEVREDPPRMVVMHTRFGGTRMIDMLVGDPLPRIC